MNQIAIAGNKGKGVRSDCFITLELTKQGGITVDIVSKVKVLYGRQIEEQIKNILSFYEIKNAKVSIEDSGAISLVIAARMEACIKRLIKTDKEYLMPFLPDNKYTTKRDKNRFTRLYLPGNTPSLALNAGIHNPDGIILDLEDAVAYDKKHEARFMVRNALRGINFYGAERMVRINQIPAGLEDLQYIIPHHINLILVPKCESAEQIVLLNQHLDKLKKEHGISDEIWLMPIIESALGVMNSFAIAKAADNIVAMAIGLEDYTADLGVKRTKAANESFFARSMLVNACKAAGIQAIDSVFSDVSDMEALKENVLQSKAIGFDGMGCIHPRQIKVIKDNYAPDNDEIERAKKIIHAFMLATEQGLGVVSLGSKMIDMPVVKRAEKTIQLALDTNRLNADWREEFLNKESK
ncbi:MAG TPA: aldolase/citrate lyase family protein [Bacteroidales bacterium]|jgi:citrate lyase subunit beta/citryl-CoA lyase|nr:HpcH/HpaI aldolase/citrate lyase family protein [Bacteroidales bacterium]HOF15552.1 aldolase/citrate lyase family protein [Bacteroidales bacterium]HON20239.1 aldolase/citrate lyase family protein [Bacteroidales bacterium]HOR82105.1 aldolase/citrate lyase family protein [Bacteroidales bacterium]HPJ90432.1 aldolase/citrate lyase family protein [Bacteroidales bacterium]